MSIDVIGNMITSMRNACALGKKVVFVPGSKFKLEILRVLKETGFIKGFQEVDSRIGFGKEIKIELKYVDGESVIHEVSRVSKSGRRNYSLATNMKPIVGGFGIKVVSTSKGVMSDFQARKAMIGGEVLLQVW